LPGAPLFYSNHHIGGFDDRVGLGAFFETEVLDRFVGDRRDYGFAAFEFDFDMRGGRTLVNFLDLAFEEIARGYFHIISPIDSDGNFTGFLNAGSSLPARLVASRLCRWEKLFGSAVLDENGFGTGPQREGLRVLVATLDPPIDRDLEFRAKVRRSVDPPDRSGHSSMQGNQRPRLGPGEIKSYTQPDQGVLEYHNRP
jgi:hypothetical protein